MHQLCSWLSSWRGRSYIFLPQIRLISGFTPRKIYESLQSMKIWTAMHFKFEGYAWLMSHDMKWCVLLCFSPKRRFEKREASKCDWKTNLSRKSCFPDHAINLTLAKTFIQYNDTNNRSGRKCFPFHAKIEKLTHFLDFSKSITVAYISDLDIHRNTLPTWLQIALQHSWEENFHNGVFTIIFKAKKHSYVPLICSKCIVYKNKAIEKTDPWTVK